MLYNLQEAIMTKFNSAEGATLRALVQGLYEYEAPSSVVLGTQKGEELEDSTLPFIVFTTILTGLEQTFCSNMFEPLVQFTIFSDGNNKSSSSALLIGDAFLALYGDEVLTMNGGYTMIRNDTVGQRKFKDPDKFWNVIYELQFIVEVNR